MAKKKKSPRTWMLPSPSQRTAKAALPERTKAEIDAKATKLIEKLKPKYVKPPPKKPQFNYITDVWIKWIGGTLYFGTTYACPFPDAISPSFEAKFARMEHVGLGRLTVDECLDAIENDWHFQVD